MRMMVTAGPTREYFDSVRFISNPSSGKMGFAIAEEAARRGHEVVLIAGPVALADPPGVRVVHVVSAQEMFEASNEHFSQCHAAVMTAAVCDYRPVHRLSRKLKKKSEVRHVELEPTTDICQALGARKESRVVVGFAMEDHDHKTHAEAKLRRKSCDAVVLNGIENVGGNEGRIEVLYRDGGWQPSVFGTKQVLATEIVTLVESLVGVL